MRNKIFAALFLFFCSIPQVPAVAAGVVDLQQFSLSHGLDYRLDPLSQIVSVTSPSGSVKFQIGSSYALSGSRLIKLGGKTLLQGSAVSVADPALDHLGRLFSSPKTVIPTVVPIPVAVKFLPARHWIRKVVIDAGHGGEDFGAISREGLREKTVVLDIAQKIRRELESRGLEVVMTRNSDVFIPLAERARIANKTKADFFVSIHANASLARSLKGFEIYNLSEATDDAALAVERAENSVLRLESAHPGVFNKELKTIVWELHEAENRRESIRISEQVMRSVSGAVSTAAQRIRSANFYVLKWTECPAVLVETGYVTNLQDERLLRSPVYRSQMAQAIVAGLWNYKTEYEAMDGFTR